MGGGYYAGGGDAMAMSAANAPDDNRDAAPAAISNLTLRIGFVLLSGEADEASHQKLTSGRCHQILKRHLTLIFKVDNLRRFFRARGFRAKDGGLATMVNDVLIRTCSRHGRACPGMTNPISAPPSASSAGTPRAG